MKQYSNLQSITTYVPKYKSSLKKEKIVIKYKPYFKLLNIFIYLFIIYLILILLNCLER